VEGWLQRLHGRKHPAYRLARGLKPGDLADALGVHRTYMEVLSAASAI